jgi:hypothetical protein
VPACLAVPSAMSNDLLESAFRAQLLLIHGIGKEISELLGSNKNQLFSAEILASISTIKSGDEFRQIIQIIIHQPERSLQSFQLNASQMNILHQKTQLLAMQYLGKEYAPEVISDLFQQLPRHLKVSLTKWFVSLQ